MGILELVIILVVLSLTIIVVTAIISKRISLAGLFIGVGVALSVSVILFAFLTTIAYRAASHSMQQAQAKRIDAEPASLPESASQQKELENRIQELEKQLEAELIPIDQETATTKTDSEEIKQGSGVDKKETVKDENASIKQKLADARVELEEEQKRLSSFPSWLKGSNLTIEKNNLSDVLSDPQSIPDQFVVSSGRFVTLEEAKKDANRIAFQVIGPKLSLQAGHLNDAQIRTLIDTNHSESLQVNLNGSPTKMFREHLFVNITPERMQALMPSLRNSILDHRIIAAATGLIGIMLISGLMSLVLSRSKESTTQG
ncbi:MAG: hypothetical protein JKY95_20110 [Planctomycetaceae bacterium]|nr:hypothetical protein [Planctomycetaceae bacterium]